MENRNSGVFSARTLNLAVILFFFGVSSVFAQAPMIEWQKCLGGSSNDNADCIRQTSDGGYIIVGTAYSSDGDISVPKGNADWWIVKLDAMGSISWEKSIGGTSADLEPCVLQTADGGYVVAGSSLSSDGDVLGNHGFIDYLIIRLDLVGNIVWQKCLGGSALEQAYSIAQTADGGYVVTGLSSQPNGDVSVWHGGMDYWIVKLDSLANIQWEKSLGGSGDDWGKSTQQTSDGGYIVIGYSNSSDGDLSGNHGNNDIWVVKLDSIGIIQWQNNFGGSDYEEAYSALQTTDNGYIIAGWSMSSDGDISSSHGSADYWIIKLDSLGVMQWQKLLGGWAGEMAYSFQSTNDGGYVMLGSANSSGGDVSFNHGSWDYWLVKMDSNGNIQWEKSLGGTGYEWAKFVQQTSDGGYVVAGWSMWSSDGDVSGNHGGADYWIVKLSPEGAPLPISLLDFDAKPTKQNTVDVSWVTASQVNNHYFDIGRSVDGESWENIYRTNGCGTCQVTMRYYTTDMHPHMGQSYYRLMQTDYDGRSARGPIVPVKIKSLGRITVSNTEPGWLVAGLSKGMRVVIYDLRGAVMLKQTVDDTTFGIDTYGYPQGCYIINVMAENMVFSAKVVK